MRKASHRRSAPDAARSFVSAPAQGPVATLAADWISAHDHLGRLVSEWQALESQLFATAVRENKSCARAARSSKPEALAMRALDEKIQELLRRLEALAGEIRSTPAQSCSEALSKIEIGLRLQGPHDWRDHALELLEAGRAELEEQTRQK